MRWLHNNHNISGLIQALVTRTLYRIAWAQNLLTPLPRRKESPCELTELREIRDRAWVQTDINDHLVSLFAESLAVHPRLIVELGVRGGESTFVLERVAKVCGSILMSVDIQDCSRVCPWENWIFVKSDDIQFAGQFPEWCRAREIRPEIDILFIDTSHLFAHTVQEIEHWFPFLSPRAKVFFHDTNARRVFFRRDKSMGVAWDTKRGVMAALENYFDAKFNERENFTDFRKDWIIRHHAGCCGLTILERVCSSDARGAEVMVQHRTMAGKRLRD